MTLEDWLALESPGALCPELSTLPDRNIHLLTAAFLRRAWELLPSHHTRTAVEATEKFADGLLTPYQLARLRTTGTLESCEALWLCGSGWWYAQMPDWERALHGDAYERGMIEGEKRVAWCEYVLPHARAGVDWPHWVAAKAAFLARELLPWSHEHGHDGCEARYQFAAFRDAAGDGGSIDPRWPSWRTDTVTPLARGIYDERAFDRLPILADALQDAGCDDEAVLSHCREPDRIHVRGCWVVDLATGVTSPHHLGGAHRIFA
jgi:hypothetical protein